MMRIAEFQKKGGGCGIRGYQCHNRRMAHGFKDVFWDWIIEVYIVILACYMLGAPS